MKRLAFLDWTRGLAVLIMIECHTFNSFVRPDLRHSGPYVFSQFVGGMAAVLFLFLAGITLSFQMDRLERRGAPGRQKIRAVLGRAGYVTLLAYLFRLNNSLLGWTAESWRLLLKVDILNCMGVSMALGAVAVLWPARRRARSAAVAGLAVAFASPVVSGLDWSGIPTVVRDYLVPNRAAFPLFPWSAYLFFGLAAGTVLRSTAPERFERTLQWTVLAGFGLVLGGQYFSNVPYSVYPKAEFWLDSPALVIIRAGLVLLILSGAYVWTEHLAGRGWSWVQTLGKTSLLVYWVHVLLVYGVLARPLKKGLDLPQTVFATGLVVGLMLLLAVARLRWTARISSSPAEPLPAEAPAV